MDADILFAIIIVYLPLRDDEADIRYEDVPELEPGSSDSHGDYNAAYKTMNNDGRISGSAISVNK